MYDLRKLEILYELSQTGSLANVADALGYNPSTVSQHLASLQKDVGQQLYEKNGRGVVLTARGEELAGYTAQMLGIMETTRIAMSSAGSTAPRTIRVVSFNSAARFMVPALFDELERKAPHLSIELTQLEAEQSLRELERHHFDIAIAEEYKTRPVSLAPSITRVDLWDDPIVVFAPANLLPQNPSLASVHTLNALHRVPWSLEPHGTEFRAWSENFFHRYHLTPNPRFISTDLSWQLDLVELGVSATVLPHLVLASRVMSDRVWMSEPVDTRTVFAAVRSSAVQDAAVQLVLETMRALYR